MFFKWKKNIEQSIKKLENSSKDFSSFAELQSEINNSLSEDHSALSEDIGKMIEFNQKLSSTIKNVCFEYSKEIYTKIFEEYRDVIQEEILAKVEDKIASLEDKVMETCLNQVSSLTENVNNQLIITKDTLEKSLNEEIKKSSEYSDSKKIEEKLTDIVKEHSELNFKNFNEEINRFKDELISSINNIKL